MKIIFRVDSSTIIGNGHITRCVTLAEELQKKGADITFITRAHQGNLIEFVRKKAIQIATLPKQNISFMNNSDSFGDDYSKWLGVTQEKDAEECIEYLHNKPDWLIVDHYGLDERWEKIIQSYVKKIMVIDDLANRNHMCDLILDQNWFQDKNNRYNGLVPSNCIRLLGPEYALLRPEYAVVKKKN